MAHWIERAAELFIEALTYGPIKGLNFSFPLGTGSEAGQYHQDKVDLLSKLRETHRDDPALRSAYEEACRHPGDPGSHGHAGTDARDY